MNDASPQTWQGYHWTEADDARLREMWGVGAYTAKHIAAVLGRSRNAVIGKAHRLKLPMVKSPLRIRREARDKRKAPMAGVVVERRPRRTFYPPPKRPAAIEVPQEPPSRNVLFAKRLVGFECAWIAGEPTFDATCCGAPCQAGSQFCKWHHGVCFHKPEPRVR